MFRKLYEDVGEYTVVLKKKEGSERTYGPFYFQKLLELFLLNVYHYKLNSYIQFPVGALVNTELKYLKLCSS